MPASPARPFPRRTLEQALRVPQALRDHNGGQEWESPEVAKALNLGAKSANFFYLTSAAKQYGLTEGTRDTASISLTELGRRAMYPASADEDERARREAFLNVPTFRGVLEHYGGNNLPEEQYRQNTLFTKFNLDPSVQDEFLDILNKNSRFAGIGDKLPGESGAGAQSKNGLNTLVGTPDQPRTIARPQGRDGKVARCFVIMPFTERDDRYRPGFFKEVLQSLFTPAIVGAGMEVRTAVRQGSDVIQSTIVKELLAADLVLADLTEHNPNVLFELGMRMANDLPVVLVRAKGTGAIFDIDNMLRVQEYSPNLWASTVEEDVPVLTAHIQGGWENRDSLDTYMRLLRATAP
jgi:hypothetical protein